MAVQSQPQQERLRLQLVNHLDAAYNLARWLTHNEHDAEDIVQAAYVRAFQHFPGFRGGDGRAWLLTIVRNCCYDFFRWKGMRQLDGSFCDEPQANISTADDPETTLLKEERSELLKDALMDLPPRYREILILRELEDLSYKEIASIVGIPIGTVMSRLMRARNRLQQKLSGHSAQVQIRKSQFCPAGIFGKPSRLADEP